MNTGRKKSMFMKVHLLVTLVTMVVASSVYAATITVKQDGTGDYTTITEAINNAGFEDIIKVYPGQNPYQEDVVIDKDLTLIGSGPQLVKIVSPSPLHGITVESFMKATIIGFEITSERDGIYVETNADVVIKNNCIVNNLQNGISFHGGSNTSIINNTIFQNGNNGITNNQHGIVVSIINNIIANNSGNGVYMRNIDPQISYNNVFANGANYTYCSPDIGNISENPRFVAPSSGNYVLRTDSPCINVGRPGSADSDLDGTRNDMGAYGGPDCASYWPYPPGAPVITNLNVTPTSVPKGSTITIDATGEVYE